MATDHSVFRPVLHHAHCSEQRGIVSQYDVNYIDNIIMSEPTVLGQRQEQ